jgi:hypothetical protein
MMLNLLFCQVLPFDGEEITRFGEACLLRLASGRYELRGGSWRERQAVKEWASLFCQEATWDAPANAAGKRQRPPFNDEAQ